jgi:hypothetical protein
MISMGITFEKHELDALLAKVGPSGLRKANKAVVRAVALDCAEGVAQQAEGGSLTGRSGTLAKAWRRKGVKVTADGASGAVGVKGGGGVRTKYWQIHETGGTLKPKGKYLLAPLAAAQSKTTGKGRRRTGALMSDLAKRRSKGGTLLLVKLQERRSIGPARPGSRRTGIVPPVPPGAIPMFALLTQIKIKASRYITRGVQAREGNAGPIADGIIAQHLEGGDV